VALDQSALLEVLDALKAAAVDDRIRQAAQTALLRCADPWHAEAATSLLDQIVKASSSNATANRRPAGSSTASS
jgi:hypothetical protein